MASDTVSAAVPAPGNPAGTTTSTQPPRGLAGLLSAIDPARPTDFNLHPTTAGATTEDTPIGGSSADYHHTPDTSTTSTKNSSTGSGKAERGIIRAWLLAGAERWKKGADARNKALDIKKAQAQAVKVAESRNVNRAEKLTNGSTNTGNNTRSDSGKSLDNKTRNHNSGNSGGSPNRSGHGGRGGRGDTGRNNPGGGGGRGTSGRDTSSSSADRRRQSDDSHRGRSHDRRHHGDGQRDHGKGNDRSRPSNSGDTNSRGQNSKGGAGQPGPKGSTGGKGPAGAPGNGGSNGASPAGSSGSKHTNPNSPKNTSTQTPGPTKVHSPGDNSGRPWKTNDRSDTVPTPAASEKKPNSPKTPDDKRQPTPGTDDKGLSKAQTPRKPSSGDPSKGPNLTKQPHPAAAGPAKPLKTQGSRETGYRDGARAAGAANHVLAYRDGARDGWKDHREHGRLEAAQLDQAHAQHKKPPTPAGQHRQAVPPKPTHPPTVKAPEPPKPTTPPTKPIPTTSKPAKPIPAPTTANPGPTTASRPRQKPKEKPPMPAPQASTAKATAPVEPLTWPADNIPRAVPIGVQSIDVNNLEFGSGAARQSISRGEVRTLKSFERVLDARTRTMLDHIEMTRLLKEHADAQAKRATYFLEAARQVEGGDNLISKLTRLAEETTNQLNQAEELYKRALRSHEAATVLSSNVKTRYSGMYRAIVNSPESVPAEIRFYRG